MTETPGSVTLCLKRTATSLSSVLQQTASCLPSFSPWTVWRYLRKTILRRPTFRPSHGTAYAFGSRVPHPPKLELVILILSCVTLVLAKFDYSGEIDWLRTNSYAWNKWAGSQGALEFFTVNLTILMSFINMILYYYPRFTLNPTYTLILSVLLMMGWIAQTVVFVVYNKLVPFESFGSIRTRHILWIVETLLGVALVCVFIAYLSISVAAAHSFAIVKQHDAWAKETEEFVRSRSFSGMNVSAEAVTLPPPAYQSNSSLSKDQPSNEQPSKEKSSEEKSSEEKSSEEKSSEEKSSEEKSLEEKSLEEQPSEENSSKEKLSEEQISQERLTPSVHSGDFRAVDPESGAPQMDACDTVTSQGDEASGSVRIEPKVSIWSLSLYELRQRLRRKKPST